MHFEVSHSFPCNPEELWAITDDPSFEARVGETSSSRREVVVAEDRDGMRIRVLKVSLQRDLPGPMKKALGGDTINYEQRTERPLGENQLRWDITPGVLRDRFVGRGTTTIRATPSGCERTIAGELSIRLPLIGGAMEKRLVDDVKASYDRAADLVRQILRERS